MSSRKRKFLEEAEIFDVLFAESDDDDASSQEDTSDDELDESSISDIANEVSEYEEETSSETEIEDFEDADEIDVVEIPKCDDKPQRKKSKKEQRDEEDAKHTWKKEVKNDDMQWVHCENDGGPIHNLPVGSTCFDYFKLFFTDTACESMIENTNKYAVIPREKNTSGTWKDIGISDLYGFICIILVMGINKLPSIKSYWSTEKCLGNATAKSTMSRNRFLKILRNFHISDKSTEQEKGDDGFQMIQKLEPLLSTLRSKFQFHFSPFTNISVDEALLKFKGRLGIVQYMPLKPAKRGIKLWMMCSAEDGYIFNFEVYCGKSDKIERTELGLGHSVVMHLAKQLKRQGHHIYFDRFYTSVPLLTDLLESKLYGTGTVMTNRRFLPQDMKKVKLQNAGDSTFYQSNEFPNLTGAVWKDKKEISMLSTSHKCEITTVERRFGGEKKKLACPLMFQKYNKYMGGVDLADQNRKYYNVSRKSTRWWMYLFWFLLDSAVSNAFILYSLTNMPLQKNPKKILQFKIDLINSLSEKSQKRKHNNENLSPNSNQQSHNRIKIKGRKKICRRCSRLKNRTAKNYPVETSYMCDKCQICLCINCFGPYHSEMK